MIHLKKLSLGGVGAAQVTVTLNSRMIMQHFEQDSFYIIDVDHVTKSFLNNYSEIYCFKVFI